MKWIVLFMCCLCIGIYTNAQQTAHMSLKDMLATAENNYPLLKAKLLETAAAKKAVEISRSSFIPTLDAAYQVNYSTYNNITGMVFPSYITPISGPPVSSNNYSGVFGTATSLLLNWQPITFGQRSAQIAYSEAGVGYAVSDAANEVFQHKIKLINAYLDAITAMELIKVQEENLTRSKANLSVVTVLVKTGIKPGVDTSLFSSELSKASVDLLNSRKNASQALITVSQLVASGENITISDSSYFKKLPVIINETDSTKHPLQSYYDAGIDLAKAKRKTIQSSTAPTLNTWGTTYARGSGIQYDGTVKAFDGLGLQRFNYGLGVQLSVPLLQSLRIKPQLQQQDLLIKANEEKLNEVTLQLNKQMQSADTVLQYAFQVVNESASQVQTSLYAYKTILSRYNAGLANYADLVQVQYNLLQAQTTNKTSYMAVWKGLLYKAAITGNLNLFLNQVN